MLNAQSQVQRKGFDDYGELNRIFFEDFSKMTTGEVGAPDFNVEDFLLGLGEYEYPWWNLNPNYTLQEHWGGMNVWPAGGTIYLECDESTGGARISLPNLDGSANGGWCVLRFKARTDAGKMCNSVFVEGAETNNMGPEWRYLESYYGLEVTDQWQQYEATFSNVGASTIFIIGAQTGMGSSISPIYIDDVEVLNLAQFVQTPTALPHSNYQGSGLSASFQANWTAVDDAEGYLLDVFSASSNSQSPDYVLQNQRVEGTSFLVENVISGADYYYTVRAFKDDYESLPSKPLLVQDIAMPENLTSTNIVDGKYTASWNEVPSAECYNYYAYFDRKADKDGEMTITNEDFTGLRLPESSELGDLSGQVSLFTIETDNGQHLDTYYLTDFTQSGWYDTMALPCNGYLKLDGWMYQYGAGDAGLISPELDLSKNNGAFDLNLKTYGITDEFGNLTSCAAALFTYDEAKGDFTQQELIYFDQNAEAWQNNTASFTKGTSRSIIGLYAVRGAENLFVDDLKITQQYKAGESFFDPFFNAARYFGTDIEVVLPKQVVDADVYHRLQAIKTKASTNPNKQFDEIMSKFTDMTYVGKGSSTDIRQNLTLSNATVQVRNSQIVVNNVNADTVELFTLAGEKVASDSSRNNVVTISVAQHGAYLVKIGKQTVKVVF